MKTYQHLKIKFHPHLKHQFYIKASKLQKALLMPKKQFFTRFEENASVLKKHKHYFYKNNTLFFTKKGCVWFAHYIDDLCLLEFFIKEKHVKKVHKHALEVLRECMVCLELSAKNIKESEPELSAYLKEQVCILQKRHEQF